jgi:hypothetical protein
MGYGSRDFITAHLLDQATLEIIQAQLPEGYDLDVHRIDASSHSVLYGSTAGPWHGIGGAAMTRFQITTLTQGNLTVVFTDETPFGYSTDRSVKGPLKGGAILPENAGLVRLPRIPRA